MGKFSRELSSVKGVEIITRCKTLILVTELAAKHCNHPNYQMESYPSLHRSYENKRNSFFKSYISCLFLISLLIYQLLNKTLFSKVNRSTWHKMSVISSLESLKRESFFQGKSLYWLVCSKHSDSGETFYFWPKIN